MKILRTGHCYDLDPFEKDGFQQRVQFIEKVPASTGTELITLNNGTTNEEVLRMMIDRMNYLQGKFPCRENAIVIEKLEESLMWLEKRTLDRKARGVEGTAAK